MWIGHSDFLPKNTAWERGAKRKKKQLWYKNPDKHCHSQVIGVNISGDKSCWECVTLVWFDEMSLHLCDLFPMTHTPSLFVEERKSKTNTNWKGFYKISDQASSKLSRSLKTRKVGDTVTAKSTSWKQNYWMLMWCLGLDPGTI